MWSDRTKTTKFGLPDQFYVRIDKKILIFENSILGQKGPFSVLSAVGLSGQTSAHFSEIESFDLDI